MRSAFTALALLVAGTCTTSLAGAQADAKASFHDQPSATFTGESFELIAHTVSAGGWRSAGGNPPRSTPQGSGISEFEIGGVIAQPITGHAAGGEFVLESGVWHESDQVSDLLLRDGFEAP